MYIQKRKSLRAGAPIDKALYSIQKSFDTEAEIDALKQLVKASRTVLSLLEETCNSDTLKSSWIEAKFIKYNPIEEQVFANIIASVGIKNSAEISLKSLISAAEHKIVLFEKTRVKKRGRPRDLVADEVAYQFARLYYEITLDLPTYADGKHGPSGKFSPYLIKLFADFGILKDIRSPLTEAIDRITNEE